MSGIFAGPGMGGWRDSGLVLAAETAWNVTRTAPFYVFSGLSALLLLGTGAGMPVVLFAWLGLSWWLARQTDDRWGRVLRHPWELGGWLAVPIGLAVAVGLGMTNLALALLLIGTMSAARWVTPRRIERTEQTVPITYAETADREQWDAWTLDWIVRDWPRVAEAAGLVYWRDIEQRMSRAAAELWVTDPLYRQEAKIRELTEGKPNTKQAVVPALLGLHVTPLGPELQLVMHDGQTPTDYERAAEAMAVAYDMPQVRVRRLEGRSVAVQLVGSDPLAAGIPELTAAVAPTDSLEYIEMGVLESGEVWRQPLLENSWVVGGVPGAGKSVALNVLLARLAGRDDVQLVLVDCKEGLEFGPWRARATAMAGSPEEALPILEDLVDHMRRRLRWMGSVGTRRMADYGHSVEHPMYVLVVDEVAELWSGGVDKATAQALVASVSKLVRLGRASSVVCVLATQKPTSDALPSAISANAPSKLAARCTTPQQVTAIFGEAIPKGQPSPIDITEQQRGYAVVSRAAGLYERGRTPYIADAAIAEIVARTRHLRRPLSAEDLTIQQPDDEDTEPVTPATSGQPRSQSYEQPLPEPLTVADLHEAGEVGARTANRLGSYTLVELTRWTRAELLDLPGIGNGSVAELQAALYARGLSLRPDDKDAA